MLVIACTKSFRLAPVTSLCKRSMMTSKLLPGFASMWVRFVFLFFFFNFYILNAYILLIIIQFALRYSTCGTPTRELIFQLLMNTNIQVSTKIFVTPAWWALIFIHFDWHCSFLFHCVIFRLIERWMFGDEIWNNFIFRPFRIESFKRLVMPRASKLMRSSTNNGVSSKGRWKATNIQMETMELTLGLLLNFYLFFKPLRQLL